ncbi:MAG: peptidoglycan DD-metalloendopeptidase family protein [Bacteroidales bacterium]|jgi:septal ring factor EnvC (AmiA/AmiB activator)|nr:peptidoglycan DD-metalloendopeptidase family protein [Bacteroidales bacterium]
MRKRNALLCVLIILLTIFASVGQKKSDQLKKNKQKIENEIRDTQNLLNQTRKNKQTSLEQASILRKQISNRESLITALNNEIFALEEEMELNEKLSKTLARKLTYMKDDYSRVVYNAYKNRRLNNKFIFILSSEDFSQMYRRTKYYTTFAKNVKRQVDLIAQTQREIEAKEIEIQNIKNEKTLLLSGEEQQLKHLEAEKKEKDKLTSSLKKKEKQLAEEIRKKQQEQKKLDKAIKEAIQKEIAAANAKNKGNEKASTSSGKKSSTNEIVMTPAEKELSTSFAGNKGRLPWPVTKCAKVKDFGTYAHPDVPSVQMQNNGIDLLTDAGATVRAVFQGTVASTLDYMGTKVVIIKHGEYMTVYQNLGSVSVKKGDKVSTKQAIGTVGKNSNSTYELHFEVWKNTEYLNPNSWLSK